MGLKVSQGRLTAIAGAVALVCLPSMAQATPGPLGLSWTVTQSSTPNGQVAGANSSISGNDLNFSDGAFAGVGVSPELFTFETTAAVAGDASLTIDWTLTGSGNVNLPQVTVVDITTGATSAATGLIYGSNGVFEDNVSFAAGDVWGIEVANTFGGTPATNTTGVLDVTGSIAVVPEPKTLWQLCAAGLLAAGMLARKRRIS